jgi:hypothetical protein
MSEEIMGNSVAQPAILLAQMVEPTSKYEERFAKLEVQIQI